MVKTPVQIPAPRFHVGDKVAYTLKPSSPLGMVTQAAFVVEHSGGKVNKWQYKVYHPFKNGRGETVDHITNECFEEELVICVDPR